LAAENELLQQKSQARINEVIKENEVLVTKLHTLEHNITELPDRASLQGKSEEELGLQRELKEARVKILALQKDELKMLKSTPSASPTRYHSAARATSECRKGVRINSLWTDE
jgi:hypothetical protein